MKMNMAVNIKVWNNPSLLLGAIVLIGMKYEL